MRRAALLLAIGFCIACGSAQDRDRLQALERRVAALEGRPEAAAAPGSGTAADVQSLERRVAALEQQMQALRERSPGTPHEGAAPAPGEPGGARIEGRRQQRLQLRELTAQYRERLAAIRRDEPDPAKRQQAVREALEWYRGERRQLLAEPPLP